MAGKHDALAFESGGNDGYGLPIGGVLATQDIVIPYAVGVDKACRMKISILDMPVETLDNRFGHYRNALENGTRFGVGSVHKKPQDHPVMDENWSGNVA